MISIRIEAPKLQRVSDRFRDFSGRFRKSFLVPSINEVKDEALRIMIEEAPKGKRPDVSGAPVLSKSFSVKSYGDLDFDIINKAPHDLFVRQGTGPHNIYPGQMRMNKNVSGGTRSTTPKKALWWPGLSHPVRWVGSPYTGIHPGTRPNPYNQKAADRMDGVLEKIFNVLGAKIRMFFEV